MNSPLQSNKIFLFPTPGSLTSLDTLESPSLLKSQSLSRISPMKVISESEVPQYQNNEIQLISLQKSKNLRHIIIPSRIESQKNQQEQIQYSPFKSPQLKRAYKLSKQSIINEENTYEIPLNKYLMKLEVTPLLNKQSSIAIDENQECQNNHQEDNFNIWGDNQQLLDQGIDISNKLKFVQLFYLRSKLYQSEEINKLSIIDEVKVIHDMSNTGFDKYKSLKLIELIELQMDIQSMKGSINYSLPLQKQKKAASLDLHIQTNNTFFFDNKNTQSPLPVKNRKLLDCSYVPMSVKSISGLTNEISPTLKRKIGSKLSSKLMKETTQIPTLISQFSSEKTPYDQCNSPLIQQKEISSPLTRSRNKYLKQKAETELNSQPALFQLQKIQTENKNIMTTIKQRRAHFQIANSSKQFQKQEAKNKYLQSRFSPSKFYKKTTSQVEIL